MKRLTSTKVSRERPCAWYRFFLSEKVNNLEQRQVRQTRSFFHPSRVREQLCGNKNRAKIRERVAGN